MALPLDTAYVRILPDLKGFNEAVTKKLGEMIRSLERSLREVDRVSGTVANNVSRNMQRAADNTAKSFRDAARNAADSIEKIDDEASSIADEIEREAARAGDSIGDQIRQGVRQAGRALGSLNRDILKTVGVFALLTTGLTATLGAFSAVSLGLSALSAALVSVANTIPQMITGGFALAAIFGTIKVATIGVGDAMSAVAQGDAKALSEAMEKLSPNAQEFIRAFQAIMPTLKEIQSTVQDRFFMTLADDLTATAEVLTGPIGTAMADLSGALGGVVSELLQVGQSTDTVGALETVFDSATMAVAKMAEPIANVVRGLLAIAESGAGAFDNFATGLAGATQGFADFLMRVSEVGFSDALGELFNPDTIMATVSSLFTRLLEFIATSIPSLAQAILEGREAFFNAVLEVFSAIVEVLPQIIPSVLEAIFGLIQSIATTLASAAPQLIDAAIDFIQGLVDGIVTALPIVIESAGTIIQEFIRGLIEAVPLLIEGAATLVIGIVEGIADNLPMILDGALEIVSTLLLGLLEKVPDLIDAGISLLEALVDGLIDFLPDLIGFVISDLIPTLLETITTQLPRILEAGITLLTELLFGLISALPQIQLFIISDLMPALIKALIDLAPLVLNAGIDLLVALVDGFTEMLPDMITFFTETFIPTVIDTIVTELPLIIETGVTMIDSLIKGLLEAAPQIASAIINDLIPGVVKAALSGGASLGRAAAQWIKDMLQKLRDNGPEIWEWFKSLPGKILDAIGRLDTLLLDKAAEVIDGFIDGIRNAFGNVKDAFSDLTDLIPSWKGPRSVDIKLLRGPAQVIMSGFADDLRQEADRVVNPALAAITRGVSASGMAGAQAPGATAALGVASAPQGGQQAETFTAEATIDLGEGIRQVVEIIFKKDNRQTKRAALAGTGAVQ